jgi:hypothetical protein
MPGGVTPGCVSQRPSGTQNEITTVGPKETRGCPFGRYPLGCAARPRRRTRSGPAETPVAS